MKLMGSVGSKRAAAGFPACLGGAPLKLAIGAVVAALTWAFPRLLRRGPIEARQCFDFLGLKGMFPRLLRRGPIEANMTIDWENAAD